MPAARRKPKTNSPAKKRKRAPKARGRHADVLCKGECRVRTTGMRVGERRRRVTPDGKKIVIRRVG